MQDLKAFYISAGEEQKPSGVFVDSSQSPVQKMMYLGEQERANTESKQSLGDLLGRARSGLSDAFGRSGLDEVVERYGKEESFVTIKLGKDMLNEQGQLVIDGTAHEKFGAKEIQSKSQLARIQQDVETARAYFPEVRMHEIKSADGKDVAIVVGADPRAFNAVMAAERDMDRLQHEQALIAQQKAEVRGQMGLSDVAAISGGRDAKAESFAHSPAAAKTNQHELA